MKISKITAIFSEFRLTEVEETLVQHGIKGFTLHPVRGRGRYFDAFNENHLVKHIQIEVYSPEKHARDIAQLIVEAAHVNTDSEGLVSILPVNELLWIHDKRSVIDNDFDFVERNTL